MQSRPQRDQHRPAECIRGQLGSFQDRAVHSPQLAASWRKPRATTVSPTPSSLSAATAFGAMATPKPSSRGDSACSKTRTLQPALRNASAADNPADAGADNQGGASQWPGRVPQRKSSSLNSTYFVPWGICSLRRYTRSQRPLLVPLAGCCAPLHSTGSRAARGRSVSCSS